MHGHPQTHICLIQSLHKCLGSFSHHITSPKPPLSIVQNRWCGSSIFSLTPHKCPRARLAKLSDLLTHTARARGRSTPNVRCIRHASAVSCQVHHFHDRGSKGRFGSKSAHERAQPVWNRCPGWQTERPHGWPQRSAQPWRAPSCLVSRSPALSF